MNIQELKQSLEYLFKANHTPFIWGHAGIGKSTVVKQYAKDKGYKFFPFYLGTQSDIGDILGLASFVKDENGSEVATTFATPLWLKDTIDYCNDNPTSGAVIFLDEFNRARKDILSGMFSLALDKTFHMLKLPDNCHIIAAGNPPTDEYFVTDVDETALMARFTHIKLEPTFEEWKTYAKEANFEPSIVSFLSEQPELLEDAKSDYKLPVKVDRRSQERWDRLFKVGTPFELIEKLAYGIIGVERIVAYKLHLKKGDQAVTGEDILSGKGLDMVKTWSNASDVKAAILSKSSDNLSDVLKSTDALDEKQSDNLLLFLEIVPKDIAYPFMKKLLVEERVVFKNFMRNPAYKDRLFVIAKEAKGIK